MKTIASVHKPQQRPATRTLAGDTKENPHDN